MNSKFSLKRKAEVKYLLHVWSDGKMILESGLNQNTKEEFDRLATEVARVQRDFKEAKKTILLPPEIELVVHEAIKPRLDGPRPRQNV